MIFFRVANAICDLIGAAAIGCIGVAIVSDIHRRQPKRKTWHEKCFEKQAERQAVKLKKEIKKMIANRRPINSDPESFGLPNCFRRQTPKLLKR